MENEAKEQTKAEFAKELLQIIRSGTPQRRYFKAWEVNLISKLEGVIHEQQNKDS